MKRLIPMAIAGLFVATAAFAQNDQKTLERQDHRMVTDTIPNTQQTQSKTFPKKMKTEQTDTTTPNPMVTEPTKTQNQQNRQDVMNPTMKKQTDSTAIDMDSIETDTTEIDTTDTGF